LTALQVQLLQWPLRVSKAASQQQLYAEGWFHPKQLIPVNTTQAAACIDKYGNYETAIKSGVDTANVTAPIADTVATTDDNTHSDDVSGNSKPITGNSIILLLKYSQLCCCIWFNPLHLCAS
jgi:hypothetical protein